jgi:hypothetical protein
MIVKEMECELDSPLDSAGLEAMQKSKITFVPRSDWIQLSINVYNPDSTVHISESKPSRYHNCCIREA